MQELTSYLNLVEVFDNFIHFKVLGHEREEWRKGIAGWVDRLCQKHNLSKVLLQGGGDAFGHDDRQLRSRIVELGYDVIHIEPRSLQEFRISEYIDENFELNIQSWEEALYWEKFLPHLNQVAERISDIQDRISRENELLDKYPYAAAVDGLEWHPRNIENSEALGGPFSKLFQVDDLKSSTNMAALFHPSMEQGVLVTKSCEYYFAVASPLGTQEDIDRKEWIENGDYEVSQGSLRILFCESEAFSTESDVHLSLYLKGGDWSVKPHPEIDRSDPKLRFIPLYHRLER